MLKYMPDNQIKYILRFFNQIWSSGTLPSSWSLSHIVPILKPGKDPTSASSYRPISLTCVLGKILEKIIVKRLDWILNYYNLYDNNQCGFRAGCSTMDHIVRLQQEIIDGFSSNQFTVCVFFDLEKAFDRIHPNTILKILHKLNIQGNMLNFVKSFLSNRRFQVRIGGLLSDEKEQEIGTPQGSVISPILFILALIELQSTIKLPVKYTLFADDLAIFLRNDDLEFIEHQLQQTVNEIQKWADRTGLSFSLEKTKIVNFHRKRRLIRPINIKLKNIQIENSDCVKFLGVYFDSQLTWKPHIKSIISRCANGLNLLKKLYGTRWGSDRTSMLKVYSSHIRPIIDYGSLVYNAASQQHLKKLNSIQNQALRLSIGAFRTSPVLSLQAESNFCSLDCRRDVVSLTYFVKLSTRATHPTHFSTFYSPLQHLYRPNLLPLGAKCKILLNNLNIDLENIASENTSSPP